MRFAQRARIALDFRYVLRKMHLRFGDAIGAGDGNRTHVTSLEGWRTTIVLRPLSREVAAELDSKASD